MQPGQGDGGENTYISKGTRFPSEGDENDDVSVMDTLAQHLAEMLLLKMQHSKSQTELNRELASMTCSPVVKEEYQAAFDKYAPTYAQAVRFLEGRGNGTKAVR
jgi:hypothetical protein